MVRDAGDQRPHRGQPLGAAQGRLQPGPRLRRSPPLGHFAADDRPGHEQDGEADGAGRPDDPDRLPGALPGVVGALPEDPDLLVVQLADHPADLVHQLLAPVRAHEGPRGVEAVAPAGGDRLLQLGQLGRDQGAQRVQARRLARARSPLDQGLQLVQVPVHDADGRVIGLEVAVVRGDQVAPAAPSPRSGAGGARRRASRAARSFP
jgi:hypothetical protein